MAIFLLVIPCSLVLSLLLLQPQPLPLLWGVVAVGLVGWAWLTMRRNSPLLQRAFALVVALPLGWQLAGLGHERFVPWPLQPDRAYHITGTVSGLPDSRFHRHRILLTPDCVGSGGDAGPCDLWPGASFLWPLQLEINIPRQRLAQPPKPGQRWEFNAHFVVPETARNPGDFDTARWYRSQHVVARFEIKTGDSLLLVEDSADGLENARFALREALVRKAQTVPAEEGLGLAIPLALVTGDRTLMQSQQWTLFNATGTTHLVAISGSHIVLVAGVVMWLLRVPLRRWLWLTARVSANQMAALGGFAAAWLYGAIAGFGLPVQRALLMLAVFVALQLAGRVQQLWFALALAFCLVLVWDPMAVYSLGFWLSFMAVYWIVWLSGGAVFRPSWMGGWLRVQAGIFVGLAPVLLWQLQNLSLVSGLTNAFSIPLAGAILTPLSLVWAVGWGLFGDAANILLVPAGWLTDIWLWMLELCADWSFSVLQLPPRSAGAMLLGIAGSLWMCTAGLPARWLAPLLFLPLLQPLLQPAQRPAEFWLRDSGGPLQLALFQSNQALFIGASTWPRLLEPWQQGFLTNWGIGAPGVDVPLADSASLWRAESWSYTLLPLRWNGLGEPEIRQFQFGDLCEAETMSAGAMSVRVLFFKRERCVVRLDVEDDSWLLWSSISVSAQRSLLQSAKTDLAVRRVLINPSTQDRLLPALLTYWQQQDTELILTTAPPPEMQQQLERSAIRFRVLDGTGPLRFAAP